MNQFDIFKYGLFQLQHADQISEDFMILFGSSWHPASSHYTYKKTMYGKHCLKTMIQTHLP